MTMKGVGTLKECEEFEVMMITWSSCQESSRFTPSVATTVTYPSIGVVSAYGCQKLEKRRI